jgi:hypothetical protein
MLVFKSKVMPEGEPRDRPKKSEVLAIENIRRIAEQLRAERNDALALAQAKTVALATAVALLAEVRASLPKSELADRIDAFTSAHGR